MVDIITDNAIEELLLICKDGLEKTNERIIQNDRRITDWFSKILDDLLHGIKNACENEIYLLEQIKELKKMLNMEDD